jgi:imidazolonepropionase-like amidohydrolase
MNAIALLPLVVLQPSSEETLAPPSALVFVNATVIDGTGRPALPHQTVVIRRNLIVGLGPPNKVKLPANSYVVDASGKFLIPGLWDMHVHLADEDFLTLFLVNGVTGIRAMHWSEPEKEFRWPRETQDGTRLGPRIVASGTSLDGVRHARAFLSMAVRGPADASGAVKGLAASGADFIKVYSHLSPGAYFAIAKECRQRKIPFAGHVPEAVSAAEASDEGQKSMEHLMGIPVACSSKEAELRTKIVAALNQSPNEEVWTILWRFYARALDSYDEGRAIKLFARFARNQTWQVPTLVTLKAAASFKKGKSDGDPQFKYLSPAVKQLWTSYEDLVKTDLLDDLRAFSRIAPKIVAAMNKAGVPLMAGTDTVFPYCFPGFSLHEELALLVDAGLSPMQALQAATSNPAKYLGKSEILGTVEVGHIADLLLLDADPLKDIRNTRKIAAVVVDGNLLMKSDREKMLDEVEARARRAR